MSGGVTSHCEECGKILPIDGYERTTCDKRCRARLWHKKYPEKRVEYQRTRNLKKWGLTPEMYDKRHAAQGGVCAICVQPETSLVRENQIRRLAVDHDHDHPDANHPDWRRRHVAVRGLLCENCNRGVGKFKNDPVALDRAAEYLRRYITGAKRQ